MTPSLKTKTLRTLSELEAAHLITTGNADLRAVADRYAIAISPAMQALIDPLDPADPIARQFVPTGNELLIHPAETADPIGDDVKSPVPGLVHRYPDRVLMKLTGMCPVYCRFCFRREMVGPDAGRELSAADQEKALAYIAATPSIWEVIVTGGDPFVLAPQKLAGVVERIASIEHVKVLRWHTRVPVVAPERVTSALVSAITAHDLTTYVGLHANHPRELTPTARTAIAKLVDAGIPVVSQTVLLKGVNDTVEILDALMRAFVEARVKPYYLHHGDLAPGTAHFRTTIAEGQALMRALRKRLSGLALPTYVLDSPGAQGKVPVEGDYITNDGDAYTLTGPDGASRSYRDACTPP